MLSFRVICVAVYTKGILKVLYFKYVYIYKIFIYFTFILQQNQFVLLGEQCHCICYCYF